MTAFGGPISAVSSEPIEIPADFHPSAARVARVLVDRGVKGPFRQFDASTKTARDAADALGVDVGAIASSLVFLADGAPFVLLKSGSFRVDVDILRSVMVANVVRMATPDEVRAATGQAIGGVSPVGWPAALPVLIDVALRDFPVLYAACGTGNAVFATTFDELVFLTGARSVTLR